MTKRNRKFLMYWRVFLASAIVMLCDYSRKERNHADELEKRITRIETVQDTLVKHPPKFQLTVYPQVNIEPFKLKGWNEAK